MRTSEAADKAGVNIQTLRYYQRRGLLADQPRTESGYRMYGQDAVCTVRFIKRAQELGFSLDAVETLSGLMEGGPDDCEQVRQLAVAHIAELDNRITDLQSMRNSLEHLVATCHLPRDERHCPLLHALGCDHDRCNTNQGDQSR